MLENKTSGFCDQHLSAISIRLVVIGAAFALMSCVLSAEEDKSYRIEDGFVDQSTYLGWRVFHSSCHGCHGVDATGTSVAPNLVEQVKRLSAREFSIKVLSRYRITVSAQSAGADDKSEMREEILQEVLRRERGDVLMPAWEKDLNVAPHVLDIYAYLRARADGALGPGRPQRQSDSE